MWTRKSIYEIEEECFSRKGKANTGLFAFLGLYLALLVFEAGSFSNLVQTIRLNPFALMYFAIFPLFGYAQYKSYIKTGHFIALRGPRKMCLYCHRGMGGGDDGWGFKRYNGRKKWFQINACETPDRCDIENMTRLKWVESGEPDHNKEKREGSP